MTHHIQGASKLVVFVPELEKINPTIMQDVFYICRHALSLFYGAPCLLCIFFA